MSSRRKSRPVRRLDMICSKLQGNQDGETEQLNAPNWLSKVGLNESSHSPEPDDEQDDTSCSPTPERPDELRTEVGLQDFKTKFGEDPRMNKTRPPEGVYILEPEAVSDDDEQKTAKENTATPKPSEARKRSYEPSEDVEPHSQNGFQQPGLDLSVKRPRIESEPDSYQSYSQTSSAPHSKSTSPKIFLEEAEESAENVNDKMEKYHHMMQLVAQQKPLAQAMEQVGLTAHEFFELHRLNNQSSDGSVHTQNKPNNVTDKILSAPPTVSTMFDKFSSKDHSLATTTSMEDWKSGKENYDAKIQALLKEANEDVIEQQKQNSDIHHLSNSSLLQQSMALNPSFSALMSSMSNGADQGQDERQEFLKNLFLKAQGYFSQQTNTPNKIIDGTSFSPNTPNNMDRSASSSSKNDSITAGTVSSGVGSIKKGTLDPANFDEDVFDQYIAKFSNMNRCDSMSCPYFTRDHYHCVVEDCNYQRFTNKADVIRHYNMHKKRDNSLAHGFLRFSPTEDCSPKYANCHLNGKSTHYHCMQPDCNKVYTSTSDVMTHENFHKKYMQFVCSGFKRFRATEQCDLESCQFRDQKTTHFHCTREDCNFSFKNKCDIEKHKTYHLRDDAYISKGFKKFYKNEACGSDECVWNYTANHFHCLRPGCAFSFTSTSQMESHKRKHDRNEFLGDTPADGKAGTSGETVSNYDTPHASSRKPDYPQVNHFKLPPKKLKFSAFIPPSAKSHPSRNMGQIPQHRVTFTPYAYPMRTHVPPLYLPSVERQKDSTGNQGSLSSVPPSDRGYLSHSILSPFSPYMAAVASRYITNSGREIQAVSGQNSPNIPMFNPALFQEAARKILSSMPTGGLPLTMSTPSTSQQLLYKTMTSQAESGMGRSLSRSESPTTPVNGSRTFTTPMDAEPSPKFTLNLNIKDEPSWKPPPPYIENQHLPNLPSSSIVATDNGILVSQASKNVLEVSRSDWTRASGVISPSMALSAAAALKPAMNHADPAKEDMKMVIENVPQVSQVEKTREINKETAIQLTTSKFQESIIKYFAGAKPYKCWVQDCDFATKHHYHCLVENCGATFSTQENMLKHAKFHRNLESMGATLPIEPVSEPRQPAIKRERELDGDAPPPGYIALQSGTTKRLSAMAFEALNRSPTVVQSPPKGNFPEAEKIPTVKNESPINPLNGLSYPNFRAQMYATALLKGVNPSSSSEPPISQPLLSSTPSSSAYRLFQNQAAYSALMNNMAQASPSHSTSHPSLSVQDHNDSDNLAMTSVEDEAKRGGGFVQFKAGMRCLRADCKYVNQIHWHCTMNRCRYVCKSLAKAQSHRQAHDSLEAYARSAKQCFRSYSVKKKCPNPNCEFRLRGHYHCLKPGCQFSTIGTSKLPWHMKKHEKIARREASGFKYFTKKEQCGQYDCKYNGLFSHYHCIRTGCTFAFQYKHQMSTHVRKHLRRMLGRSYTGDVHDIDHTNVDSGDDSLPLIIDEVEEAEQRPGVRSTDEKQISDRGQGQQMLSRQQMEVLERMTREMKSSFAAMSSARQEADVHNGISAEQDPSAHISSMDPNMSNSDDNSSVDYGALDLSSMAAGSSKSNESSGQHLAQDVESMNEDSMSNGMGNTTDEGEGNMENEESVNNESPTTKTSPTRGPYVTKFKLNDDLLSGFRRFDTNEQCGEETCPYTFKVSHYHCTRDSCSYRFTGRTHMFKHQQHHDRVAGLVRDDFKRFKATNPCDEEQCEFRGKSTHFHCLRCDFKCTDSAKVGTHRRQHMKADIVEKSGFQQVRGKDDCGREDCKYRFRNMSHFHCLQPGCHYTMVGQTGMQIHADKHRRGFIQSPGHHADNAKLILQNFNVLRKMQQQMYTDSIMEKLTHNGLDESAHSNLSLSALREMQTLLASGPQTPTSPQVEGSRSNQSSPFMMTSQGGDPSHLLSKFAFLSSATPAQDAMVTAASSPVSSTAVSMVTEGVGS